MDIVDKQIRYALDKLRGRALLYHRTSLVSFESIVESGFIKPNLGQYKYTYGVSERSLGRSLKSISLFDFDSRNINQILEHAIKWISFLSDLKPLTVVIGISREKLENTGIKLQYEWDIPYLKENPNTFMRIPSVEVFYVGEIPVTCFEKIFIFKDSSGNSFYEEFDFEPSILETLSSFV